MDAAGPSFATASAFIGNVAQVAFLATSPATPDRTFYPDFANVVLGVQSLQIYKASPSYPRAPGIPFFLGGSAAGAQVFGCGAGQGAWTPSFAVKDVSTVYGQASVSLVDATRANSVRCFVTGITGAWSASLTSVQPYVAIEPGPAGDIRLFTSPYTGDAAVGATASCINLR